jgi:3-hydroxyacyl-[acyl-carrier protein] dehydratase/trans-2-decenoyl-[acyl-carrier protein] isomerase
VNVSSFNRLALIECTQGRLLCPEAPRLPAHPLLAFDEVTAIASEGGSAGLGFAQATKRTEVLDPILASHFVGDPVAPGCLLIEGLLQLTGFFAGYTGFRGRGRAARLQRVEFIREITPSDELMHFEIHVRKIVSSRQLVISSGIVKADLKLCVSVGEIWISII